MSPSKQPAVLITGASGGIGFATLLACIQQGWHVFAACRSLYKLNTCIDALGQKLSEQDRAVLYAEIGKRLASHLAETNCNTLRDRVKAATNVADSLGAATYVEDVDGAIIVRSYTCPIASMVREDRACCRIIQEFFAHATGHTCVQECKIGNRVVCQYRISKD